MGQTLVLQAEQFNVYGTPLPYIQKMVVPAVIRKGDNLDVSIEATGGN